MGSSTRRASINVAVMLLLSVCVYLVWPRSTAALTDREQAALLDPKPQGYTFPRDANYHGFSKDECAAAFPNFSDGIESAAAVRKDNPVQLEELEIKDDHCLVRVLIYDSEIFIIQGHLNDGCWIGRWHERTSGFLHAIHEAVISAPPHTMPNIEFVLDLDDDPQRPIDAMHGAGSNQTSVWGLTHLQHQQHIWLVPDYAYWAWPSALVGSHTQIRRKMKEASAAFPWRKKISKVVWRGVTHLNPTIREPLVQAAEAKSWGDVKVCDIYVPETKKYCITQDQHCQYKFPIHTEGYTYSGRLKYLQLCNSAPVVHELKWIEHHHHLMRSDGPRKNFIQVKNDWSDLEDKILYYLDHEDEAMAIARNNQATFYERYLTPAATSCYWRHLFYTWASVQGFEPKLYKQDPANNKMVLRGIPFAAYALDARHPMPEV